jgi:hypothetical protein
MTTEASQPGHAYSVWPSNCICEMPVTIIALLRVIGGSVAIDAAW